MMPRPGAELGIPEKAEPSGEPSLATLIAGSVIVFAIVTAIVVAFPLTS